MNKKWFQLWNIGRLRARLLDLLSLGRTMLVLAAGSLVFFMLLGAGGVAGSKLGGSPLPSMNGLAASLSSGFFMDMLGMEVPHLPEGKGDDTLSGGKVTAYLFELLTSVNPNDPKTLLSREVPGMGADDPVLLRKGSGGIADGPADYHPGTGDEPPSGTGGQGAEASPAPSAGPAGEAGGTPEASAAPGATTAPDGGEPAGGGEPPAGGGASDPAASQVPDTSVPEGSPAPSPGAAEPQQGEELDGKGVFIYHSHPREAYNPLLGVESDNPSSASPDKNVMLVGSYIAKRLEERGVGALHSKADYATEVEDYNWNFSYKYSRMTVKAAMAENETLTQFIDIHRDSQRHKKTTAVIDGKSYAQVYFILGHGNKNWKKNEAFANEIHKRLEAAYPGLSRGIWGKSSSKGTNGEYNQSLSPNSVLIEVGGIDSTNEELKRTADILGDMIAEVYWSHQKADKAAAPASK